MIFFLQEKFFEQVLIGSPLLMLGNVKWKVFKELGSGPYSVEQLFDSLKSLKQQVG